MLIIFPIITVNPLIQQQFYFYFRSEHLSGRPKWKCAGVHVNPPLRSGRSLESRGGRWDKHQMIQPSAPNDSPGAGCVWGKWVSSWVFVCVGRENSYASFNWRYLVSSFTIENVQWLTSMKMFSHFLYACMLVFLFLLDQGVKNFYKIFSNLKNSVFSLFEKS